MKPMNMTITPAMALVVIDIQKDYFPGGAMALEGPEEAARNAARVIEAFRQVSAPVFHIQHEMPPERGLPFLLPGTEGQEIHPSVAPAENETVVVKHLPNAFAGTALEALLRERDITQVVVVGMMTQLCVTATTHGAMERGFSATVVGDATATRDLLLGGERIPARWVKKAHLSSLSGVCATITSTHAFLGEIEPAVAG